MTKTASVILVLAAGVCAFAIARNTNSYAIPKTIGMASPKGDKIDTSGLIKVEDKKGLITFTTGLDNSTYMVDKEDSKTYVYLEAKAGKYVPEGNKRTPLNLCVVIDHSGSMAGDKLVYAKKAAKFVVDKLGSDDYLSIVEYDSKVNVVWKAQAVKNKDKIKELIDGIQDNSGTNLGGGLLEGYSQVKSTFKQGYVNRVLLMSDGLANEGITNVDALRKIAKEYCQEYKVSVSTFGIGLDFNENLMTGIAMDGCGNYYFIDDPEHIPTIFEKELNGLLNLVASDVKLTLRIPKGVQLEKAFGYKYEQVDDVLTVYFRDVFAEETKGVMFKFTILAGTNTTQNFTAELTYKNAVTTEKADKKLTANNALTVAENKTAYDKSVCEKVKEKVILFESTELMDQALIESDNGNYEKARALNSANANYLQNNAGYVQKSAELQKQASSNKAYEKDLQTIEKADDQGKKKIQKKNKETNYRNMRMME